MDQNLKNSIIYLTCPTMSSKNEKVTPPLPSRPRSICLRQVSAVRPSYHLLHLLSHLDVRATVTTFRPTRKRPSRNFYPNCSQCPTARPKSQSFLLPKKRTLVPVLLYINCRTKR